MNNHESWMRDNFNAIKDKKLKHMWLPGTHDSATASFQRIWTYERKYDNIFVEILRKFENSWDQTDRISDKWTALWGTAQATELAIKEQLVAGVRAFDFRVWPKYNSREYFAGGMNTISTSSLDGFYAVHGFLAENYKIIIPQIVDFLNTHSGEILYLRFRFYDENKIVSTEDIKKFLSYVTEQLLSYIIPTKDGNPFEARFGDLIGSDKKSRVIIHYHDEDFRHIDFKIFEPKKLFFSTDEIGMIGDSNGNDHTVDSLINKQMEYVKEAWDKKCPCSLWIVSVPDNGLIKKTILDAMFKSDFERHLLRRYAKIFNDAIPRILDIFQKFNLSAVYVDWVEDTSLIEEAIKLSIRDTSIGSKRHELIHHLPKSLGL
jgi:hypothetical protein